MECYAKELLESLMPERYSHLSIKEKPDIQMSDDYGIEVTWAMYDNQGRGNGLLTVTAGKRFDDLDAGIVRNIEKSNLRMITGEDGCICGYTDKKPKNRVTNKELYCEYKKKIEKVRGYPTETIDLFIFPALAHIDGWLGEKIITDFFATITEEVDCPFNNIIVYEEPTLYMFDYKNSKLLITKGTEQQIKKCKEAADNYSGYSKRYKQ